MANWGKVAVAAAIASLFGAAGAAPLGLYGASIDKTSPACLTIGDAVSCSAPLLNYFAGKAPSTKVAAGGYVLPTPQGALDGYIVVGAGGGAQGNEDIDPISPAPPAHASQVENGFKSNDVQNDDFFATGKADGSTVVIGNMDNPGNNLLPGAWDNPGTWDVGIAWLIDALTIGGLRRELMIGFDYNQPQSSETSLNYWALVTVRGEGKADVNFEIRNPTGQTYQDFITNKGFASQPASTDFATVNGVTCIDTNGSEAIPIAPQPGGNCSAGYEVTIDNAQSTADTEIFAFLPELNANLAAYLAGGYTHISTRILFGCFGGEPGGNFQPGVGYLSDSGTTTHCESGGFGDVYLLAGDPMRVPPPPGEVPEPAGLALVGLGLLGLTWVTRRRRGV